MRKTLHCSGVVIIAAMATPAAAEVTISTARTTPVQTSTIANGAPDNVTVNSAGSVAVETGAAITIDSDNTVSNAGTISTENDNDTTGILVTGARTTTISNSGTIRLNETAAASDSDNDGDNDTPFAVGSGRTGIAVALGGSMTGNITNSGTVTVVGNNSYGVRLQGALTGDLSLAGSVSATGTNVRAVSIEAPVTGRVATTGALAAIGEGASALAIDGAVSGDVKLGGTISSTGYRFAQRFATPEQRAVLDADDLLQGGPTVQVRADIGGGVEVRGVGVENDDDDDGDGATDDADDNLSGAVQGFGSAPTVRIAADGADAAVTLGAGRDGFGLVNRGSVAASGVWDGASATAMSIEGAGGTVNVARGLLNDGSISATAFDADGTGVRVGAGATVNEILNRGQILTAVSSDTGSNAIGLDIQAGAQVSTLRNAGLIGAAAQATEDTAAPNAVAIRDRSGGLALIENTGTIDASLTVLDQIDDGVTPTPLGEAVAIDLSANTTGVVVRQNPQTVFTDDDSTDDVSNAALRIVGDILLGSGADLVEINAGTVTGDIAFGAGADQLVLRGGAAVTAALTDADASLAIDVENATLTLRPGAVQASSARFGAGSQLVFSLADQGGQSAALNVSGGVTFENGAALRVTAPAGLADVGAVTILTAGTLTGAANVTGAQAVKPYIYDLSIDVSGTDPNALVASYSRKSAGELGLSGTRAAVYEPAIQALRSSTAGAQALTALETQAEFDAVYETFLPQHSGALRAFTAAGTRQARSLVFERVRTTAAGERQARRSGWIQEFGYFAEREGATPQRYEGAGFGFGGGFDQAAGDGAVWGVSAALLGADGWENGRENDNTTTYSQFQVGAFYGGKAGPLVFGAALNGGTGQAKSRRVVNAEGAPVEIRAERSLWSGGAGLFAEAPMRLGPIFTLSPHVAADYLAYGEGDYAEDALRSPLAVEVDAVDADRANGEAGVRLRSRSALPNNNELVGHLYVAKAWTLSASELSRTIRFAGGGQDFTLDEAPLPEDGLTAGLGFEVVGGALSARFSYDGEFYDDAESHAVSGSLRLRF